jgi:NADPH:quinone reductase-like Zn-dependent oxidoreductase
MKASVHTRYGPPEVLQIKEVEKPAPKANEVLVKIHATTVNRTDTGFRKAEYFIIRLFSGFFKPKKTILGSEFAGVIESVGQDVQSFKTGDAVFGLSTYNFGTHAQYICLPENGSIAEKPANLSFNEAAAVCDGLMLAINYIRKINFTDQTTILINGASGSIGSAAVQLARYYGANITAVCSTKSMELIKTLGASEVIDYSTDDFTKTAKRYDIVLDAVGKSSFFRCKKLLKPRGIYFSTELGYLSQNIYLALLTPLFFGKKVMFPIPKDSKEDIMLFKRLIQEGSYKAVIDRIYPFEQIIEATRYVETGEKVGNVVISLEG